MSMHKFTNENYEIAIDANGSGYSSWRGLALTRWREDPSGYNLGILFYLRDLATGEFWSLGSQSTYQTSDLYQIKFIQDGLQFERQAHELTARLNINLIKNKDLEQRTIILTNHSSQTRRIEVTSYLEIVLFPAEADAAHPAFAKLFVQTERDPLTGSLLAHRRPRSNNEQWPWLVHALSGVEITEWETDRLQFIGRGRTLARPLALANQAHLSSTVGNVLDPIFSLRTVLELKPGETQRELNFFLGVAAERLDVLELLHTHVKISNYQTKTINFAHPKLSLNNSPQTVENIIDLKLFNGYGGFNENGREYIILLPWKDQELRRPPSPWINVIANEHFGTLVSETGAGYTWARNSQAHRLTPWFNDPVIDPHGEAWYIRNDKTGETWSPLPGPKPAPVSYQTKHGLGYSNFCCDYNGLLQKTVIFVPREDPVKICAISLTNQTTQPLVLSLFNYHQLILADRFCASSKLIQTSYDPLRAILRAINPQAGDFANGIVFASLYLSEIKEFKNNFKNFTCDCASFLGPYGDPTNPIGIQPGVSLNNICEAGAVPCFVQQITFCLEPNQQIECISLLGEVCAEADLDLLLARYRTSVQIQSALNNNINYWYDLIDKIQIKTPDPALDLMVNAWLPYQILSCRIWARSAFYQSGGAYGYRDQLQDAAALVMLDPAFTRNQILLHAAHQFQEGDVLHWWHPEPLKCGLRTRFSDDLLWLPAVTARYVQVTGDHKILAELIPFLTGSELISDEDERYLKPEISAENADLYTHCCRALDRSLTQGIHGLPLMGTGDWNDGMNRVGRAGRGESVWLGFFLDYILTSFIPICALRSDSARIEKYKIFQDNLRIALEIHGWDGAWYRRAYDDDEIPLGSVSNDECQIDALAQAWAVISGVAPRARAEQALDSLEQYLISEQDGLIKLLTPPFMNTKRDPGYIKGYVAGVRENGGQYTHAACWSIMALALLGRCERAAQLLSMLTPIHHTKTLEDVKRYRLEPYVIAADIYGEPPHIGRGGWSWYTGAAGWFYRVALESILGITLEHGRTIRIQPCIPKSWSSFQLRYRLPDALTQCIIFVKRVGDGSQLRSAYLDNQACQLNENEVLIAIPNEKRKYQIEVSLG